MTELKTTRFDFFWGGPFSNWSPSEFILDGITYNCVEQYMMYQKAITFGDDKTAANILAESSPREQKALGRLVSNYDDAVWSSVRYEIVKKGLREKFVQNKYFLNYLLTKKGLIIVEASPKDSIWGIGYNENNAINNYDTWGQNLLGKMLNELLIELSKTE